MIDYTGMANGEPVGEKADGLAEGMDFWIMIGSDPEVIPGLSAEIAGASIGDQKEINVHFPDDYRVTAVAGTDAVYSVKVKEMREKKPPVLDEALLKRFDVDSEQALKERIRADLMADKKNKEDARLKDEIVRHLLSKTSFDLPDSIVAQETERIANSMLHGIMARGGTREQVEEQRDSIIKNAQDSSVDRVRASYILKGIADAEAITVEDADIDQKIDIMAMRYGISPAQVRTEMNKENRMEGLRSEILADKALDFLLENSKIK
jgi:trigger factor